MKLIDESVPVGFDDCQDQLLPHLDLQKALLQNEAYETAAVESIKLDNVLKLVRSAQGDTHLIVDSEEEVVQFVLSWVERSSDRRSVSRCSRSILASRTSVCSSAIFPSASSNRSCVIESWHLDLSSTKWRSKRKRL